MSVSAPSFFTFILIIFIQNSKGDVEVIKLNDNHTIDVFIDIELGYAANVPYYGISGFVALAKPDTEACHPIEKPPSIQSNHTWIKFFALVRRFGCSLPNKLQNVMEAGYHGAIIYNVERLTNKYDAIFEFENDKSGISILGVIISYSDGLQIKNHYLYDQNYYVKITPDIPFNLNVYLLPFAIIIGICLLVMICFMIVRCVRDRRKLRKHRLSYKHLKKIPTTKFSKGDQYDTCPICLEDYVENEKLRVLPCTHVYHTKCIDPWLTKNKKICPVCKGKVIVEGMSEDSDSDTDSESAIPARNSATERTPLLSSYRPINSRERSGSSESSEFFAIANRILSEGSRRRAEDMRARIEQRNRNRSNGSLTTQVEAEITPVGFTHPPSHSVNFDENSVEDIPPSTNNHESSQHNTHVLKTHPIV